MESEVSLHDLPNVANFNASPPSEVRMVDVVVDEQVKARFWSKVQKRGDSECWEWQGGMVGGTHRYGVFRMVDSQGERHSLGAHRVAWRLTHGAFPEPGTVLCHRCDCPTCVNPAHLFPGTQKENIRDCIGKQRNSAPPVRPGEQNVNAKLTPEAVKAIRLAAGGRGNIAALALENGVSAWTITQIRKGRAWKHI